MTGKEYIKKLRKDFGIEEPKTTAEEDDYERRYRKARERRINEAGYIDNYVKMFNRDYWTDQWLGPGPDPGYQYMEEAPKSNKLTDAEIEKKQWRDKYVPKNLPQYEFNEPKVTKAMKKERKRRQKEYDQSQRQDMYDLTYWYLEVVLQRSDADRLYSEYADDIEELVDVIYPKALSMKKFLDHDFSNKHDFYELYDIVEQKHIDEKEVVSEVGGLKFRTMGAAERKRRYYDNTFIRGVVPDIPTEYEDEFKKWEKKHPLKDYKKRAKKLALMPLIGETQLQHIDFIDKINKKNRGFRKRMLKSGMNLYDPITGQGFVSEKKMKTYIAKRMKNYDRKRKEFVDLLDRMVKQGTISEDMAINWLGDSEEARERVENRYRDMKKRIKQTADDVQKDRDHHDKFMKARDNWFKDFGGNPNGDSFKVCFDGEPAEITRISKKGKGQPFDVMKVHRPTTGIDEYLEI